jgi:hypothetical protein
VLDYGLNWRYYMNPHLSINTKVLLVYWTGACLLACALILNGASLFPWTRLLGLIIGLTAWSMLLEV